MKAIGLDIGTTSICGISMDLATGKLCKVLNHPNRSWLDTPNTWEKIQDPNVILHTVTNILETLADSDTKVIGVTGQMHGIVYYDAKGKVVSPLYTWQDGRGDLPVDSTTCAQMLQAATGYGNVTHLYNKLQGLVPETAVGFCTIHDYLVMRLTGHTEALVHSSDAASFGAYDLETNVFTHPDPLQPATTKACSIGGFWNNIPVAVAIGDSQASFLGGGCDEHTVLVNVGTGSQISYITNQNTPTPGMEIRPLNDDTPMMVGSSLCGGRAYALLKQFFGQVVEMAGGSCDDLYSCMANAVEPVAQTDLIFETLFSGTRAEPHRKAELRGLSLENFTPGDLIFSCLEGIASELFELYKRSGGSHTRLVGTGNGIRRNRKLQSIFAQKFGIPMQIPAFSEEAAVGAALFALTACGVFPSLSAACKTIQYIDL